MMCVAFVVPGQPQGKGRPRIGKVGAHARMFTPPKTVAYQGLVALAAQQAMGRMTQMQGPVSVDLSLEFGVPASWSKGKRADALMDAIKPTVKPDADNVVKAVFDGLNGVLWRDDVQVTDLRVRKKYAEQPCVRVWVGAEELPV